MYFITHGNMGVLRDWRSYYIYGVMDYLMKGYTVVIYENLSTLRRVKNVFNQCPASFPFANAPSALYGNGVPILVLYCQIFQLYIIDGKLIHL